MMAEMIGGCRQRLQTHKEQEFTEMMGDVLFRFQLMEGMMDGNGGDVLWL